MITTFSLHVNAQEVSIVHYQRNNEMNEVILPHDRYNSSLFDILVPDSVYSAGKITIKHLTFSNFKSSAKLLFSNNTYSSTTFTIKKKHISNFEESVLAKTGISSLSQKDLKQISLSLVKVISGRRVEYTFAVIQQ